MLDIITMRENAARHYLLKEVEQNELTTFNKALQSYLGNLNNFKNENEKSLVANALKPFFENLGFESIVGHKQTGNSEIDLALLKNNEVQVIIECKKQDSSEMLTPSNINCKALHEAILYYFRQSYEVKNGVIKKKSDSVKFIIITDFITFYIFRSKIFEEFCKDRDIKEAFLALYRNNPASKIDDSINQKDFYDRLKAIFEYSAFPLQALAINVDSRNLSIDNEIMCDKNDIFKILHRDFLFGEFEPNTDNTIKQIFYDELLYILGLQKEAKGSNALKPAQTKGSLYDNIFSQLPNHKQDFENAMSLIILWLNRILFLKLIEANLLKFNSNDKNLKFLNTDKIKSFSDLQELFFKVLAVNVDKRENINDNFAFLPYLNSSLFIMQDIENKESPKYLLEISSLKPTQIAIFKNTILVDDNNKRKSGECDFLSYLFTFLDAYNFDSYQKDNAQKSLINSAVLGLVFEQLNAYKDGSFYTPSFITSYMTRNSLFKIVLDKFNAKYNCNARDYKELRNDLRDKNISNDTIKNELLGIRILDPAVGSGHFLVSALNEMIKIHNELNLFDEDFEIKIQKDEILVIDRRGNLIEYLRPNNTMDKTHAIQKEIFHIKKTIIENNLFGVDINANSVQICRLRLWIELLKSSYYLDEKDENFKPNLPPKIHQMQTLPNIDINIKCGNSLISYFHLNQSLTHYPNIKAQMQKYKIAIKNYKEGFFTSKDMIGKEIKALKESFKNFCFNDKFKKEIKTFNVKCENYSKKYGNFLAKDDEDLRLYISQNFGFFEFDENEAREEFALLKKDYESIFNLEKNKPFEWRFEFPEVLDENGDFMGFDIVIGNPPYGVKLTESQREFFKKTYKTSQTNTASLFIFLSDKILAQNGINTLIVPKSLNYVAKWEQVRSFIAPTLYLLADCSKAWDEVLLEMVIFARYKNKVCQSYENLFLQETKQSFHNIDRHDSTLVESRNDNYPSQANSPLLIDKSFIELFGLFINGISQEELNLGVKLTKNNEKLEKFCKNSRGITYQKHLQTSGKYGFIGGKEISRFGIKQYKGFINSINDITKNAFIDNNSILVQNIVTQNHIVACLPDKEAYLLDTINQISLEKLNSKLLWAILNSTLINRYVAKFIYANAKMTMHLDSPATDKIPIPKITKANQKIADEIIKLADKILALKSKNAEVDVSGLEKEMDSLVYKLYGLSSDEITIIEEGK